MAVENKGDARGDLPAISPSLRERKEIKIAAVAGGVNLWKGAAE